MKKLSLKTPISYYGGKQNLVTTILKAGIVRPASFIATRLITTAIVATMMATALMILKAC